jgi:hypothetical protein
MPQLLAHAIERSKTATDPSRADDRGGCRCGLFGCLEVALGSSQPLGRELVARDADVDLIRATRSAGCT